LPLPLVASLRILGAMSERMISEVLIKPDAALEMTLRPSLFSEFTGQAKVKEPNSRERKFEEVVKEAQEATALVLVY